MEKVSIDYKISIVNSQIHINNLSEAPVASEEKIAEAFDKLSEVIGGGKDAESKECKLIASVEITFKVSKGKECCCC
jgi:hypothetical protein